MLQCQRLGLVQRLRLYKVPAPRGLRTEERTGVYPRRQDGWSGWPGAPGGCSGGPTGVCAADTAAPPDISSAAYAGFIIGFSRLTNTEHGGERLQGQTPGDCRETPSVRSHDLCLDQLVGQLAAGRTRPAEGQSPN